MKKIFKYLGSTAAVAACALPLTGCVEETLPQSSMATDKIVAESTSATEGIANGMPAYATDVWSTSSHCYFGYPAEMIVRGHWPSQLCILPFGQDTLHIATKALSLQ